MSSLGFIGIAWWKIKEHIHFQYSDTLFWKMFYSYFLYLRIWDTLWVVLLTPSMSQCTLLWHGVRCSASTFKEFSLFLPNLRNFECLKEFFKEFQGNLRKEKEIIQKFREFKEIWVKCKENESNSRKITISEALARSHISFKHVIAAEKKYKRA